MNYFNFGVATPQSGKRFAFVFFVTSW